MIAYLEGTILLVRAESVIVKAGSVGYEVFLPNVSSWSQGEECSLYTYQQIREDGQALYGFETEKAYQIFTMLIKVRGIGCKLALNVLSAMDPDDLLKAIEASDTAALKKLPGIGVKTAGQIILDLKGKIVVTPEESSKKSVPAATSNWQSTRQALLSLGYKNADIAFLDDEFASSTLPESDLLRQSLKLLAMQKGMGK